ncbi:MAG: hypothetical protein ABR529_13685 [Actinomycetota bacterium]
MTAARSKDFFDWVRVWAVAVMLAAGVAAIVGSALEWVTITVRPELRQDTLFDAGNEPEEPEMTKPFTGLAARDGWWSLAGGVILIAAALLLLVRQRARWGWLGVIGAVLIGAVAIADYRGIGNLSSNISRRLNIVGEAEPGIGLTLVVAAALIGLIGSVAGIAASPPRRNDH